MKKRNYIKPTTKFATIYASELLAGSDPMTVDSLGGSGSLNNQEAEEYMSKQASFDYFDADDDYWDVN